MAALTKSLSDTLTLTGNPGTVAAYARTLADTLTLIERLQLQNPSFFPLVPWPTSFTPLNPLSPIVLPPAGD